MSLKKVLPLLSAVALSVLPDVATAAPLTFTFSGGESATMEYEVEGVNFNATEPNSSWNGGVFDVYEDGLEISGGNNVFAVSRFLFEFDTDVALLSYQIARTNVTPSEWFINIVGGSVSSIGAPVEVGTYVFDQPLLLEAGVSYEFTTTGITGFAYLENFVVDVIPEPSSMTLFGGAALVTALGYRRTRR